jgi:hypothetical protein
MVIAGEWSLEEDGILRPTLDLEVLTAAGAPVLEAFLVDTGADCTVFSARLLGKLALPLDALATGSLLHGLGGQSGSVFIDSALIFATTDGRNVTIKGRYVASTEATALDVSVLGRDVLANFDVIVSRRRNEVLLVAGNHGYAVTG